MKDFADFKQSLTGEVFEEVLDKATDYANKMIEQNCNKENGVDKAYAFNRYCNEGTIVYLLEKYHEWLNQK